MTKRLLIIALCILINTAPAIAGFWSGGGSGGLTGVATPHAQGDTVYADTTTTWAVLAKDANATRAICNTGASNNPAWCQINLTTGVTGTLPVVNGGTGGTSYTSNKLIKGNTTNPLAVSGLDEDASGNLGIAGQVSMGTNAAKVFGQPVGTAPESSPGNMSQLYVVDKGGVADKAAFHMRDEAGNSGPVAFGNKIVISHSASESATANTLYGDMHLVTGAYTVTLPATVVGMNAIFCSTTAAVFSIDLTGSDAWTLAGTALTAANKITSSGAAGECVYFIVTATNVVRTIWTVGVFIDGGA